MGVIFAFLALVSWGIGDFLIQRSTRIFGDVRSLFFIDTIGAILLLPFVYPEISATFRNTDQLLVLMGTSALFFVVSLTTFEALRRGKISVIEPVFVFELFITTLLAIVFIREIPNVNQMILLGTVLIGVVLVSIRSFHDIHHFRVERGVWLAVLATIGMAGMNFLFGVVGRYTSPLMVNWFTGVFNMIATGTIISMMGGWKEMASNFRQHPLLVSAVSVFDNAGWLFFTYSASLILIPLATGISESYIALSALLGIFINRERLSTHQKIGLAITIISAVALGLLGF